MQSKYWLSYKIIVFYCFLSSARACLTLGDNPMIDLALSAIGLIIVPPSFYQQSKQKICAAFFLGLAAMYTMLGGNLTGYVAQFVMVLIPIQIIFLDSEHQIDLFKTLSTWYAVLLGISILWWILFLVGIPLPHISQKFSWGYDEYGFIHQNYFFFRHSIRLNPYVLLDIVPRFNGFFLEPGHIGTITSLFLFANNYNLKNRLNIIFLVVIIISFSAAAYVLTLLGYLLYRFSERLSNIVVPVIISIIAVIIISVYNDGNNLVNELIFGKITREQGAVDGRFSAQTQMLWEQILSDGRIWFGVGAGAKVPQSAGYKVFLIMNGIFGAFLIIMAYWYIMLSNYSKKGLYMFVLLMISFLQRCYCFWDAFLDPYILGMIYLQISNQSEECSENLNTESLTEKES